MNGAIGFDEDYQKTIADIEGFEVDVKKHMVWLFESLSLIISAS